MPPLSNNRSAITRRSVSLRANWREFLAEYKAIREWLERMTSVIDWAEQRDLPSSYLEKVFKVILPITHHKILCLLYK